MVQQGPSKAAVAVAAAQSRTAASTTAAAAQGAAAVAVVKVVAPWLIAMPTMPAGLTGRVTSTADASFVHVHAMVRRQPSTMMPGCHSFSA